MCESFPAVTNYVPAGEKSIQWIEFSFSSIEKSFFIVGICKY
jgi:hypothetical protein